MAESEFSEAYDEDATSLRGAIMNEPISVLDPRKHVEISGEISVREAITLMNEHHTGCVLVVEDGKLAGIFTERDLLRIVQEEIDTSAVSVSEVMTPDPDVLRPEHRLALALNEMAEGGFRHIPLVDGQRRPVGIVAMRDIVRFIVSMFPDAVLNVPPDPAKIPKKYGG